MILVDMSIWVDHIRRLDRGLLALLKDGSVLCLPFIIGELAVGNLPRRSFTLSALAKISHVTMATNAEVLRAIEIHKLYANGAGYIDIHLLISVKLTPGTLLWTRDKTLSRQARKFDISLKRL